jgi:hypothetical protein
VRIPRRLPRPDRAFNTAAASRALPLVEQVGAGDQRRTPRVHVAINISNVHFSAQLERRLSGGPAVRNPALRLHVAKLSSLIASDPTSGEPREVVEQWGATSASVTRDPLVQLWEHQGYTIRRLNLDASGHETGVDMTIHAVALDWLAERQYPAHVQPVLVLVTDGGNDNGGNATTFPTIVEAAVRFGWRVQIYSWRCATHRRLAALAAEYEQVELVHLDRWRNQLIFVQDRANPAARPGSGPRPPNSAPHGPDVPLCRNGPATCPFGVRCRFRHVETRAPAWAPPPPPPPPAARELERIRPPTPPAAENLCCICLDEARDTALTPCFHASFCGGCAEQFRGLPCPMCRQRVRGVQRIYL